MGEFHWLYMPKLKPDSITQADLEEFLADFDNFQFEMEVLKMCSAANLSFEHGWTYVDPVLGIDRQFDIRIRRMIGKCEVKLAVECKNLKQNFPLLVSRVSRLKTESYHSLLSTSRRGSQQILKVERSARYPLGRGVGKSTNQVGRLDQRDELLHVSDKEV
jgi:hypothetical protein